MAEEIIGVWNDSVQLTNDILLRKFTTAAVRLHSPSGVKVPDDCDVDDYSENRVYRLIDGNGNEISFPLTLISNTKVII